MNPQRISDHRTAERFAMSLPITLEGEEGVTLDLSANGILLETAVSPAVGSRVSLDLRYDTGDVPCHLHCEGEVVRVLPPGEVFNVAVRLVEPLFR